jgi:hypothetical protein
MSDRECPCCAVPIKRGQLLCRDCWYRVPVKLRRAVNEAWNAFRRHPEEHLLEYRMATAAATKAANDARGVRARDDRSAVALPPAGDGQEAAP